MLTNATTAIGCTDTASDFSSIHYHDELKVGPNPISDALDVLGRENVEMNDDGCWLWDGSIEKSGYGFVMLNDEPKSTHRVMAAEAVGDVDGVCVLHLCGEKGAEEDRRNCINPYHLTTGDRALNTEHSIDRGRFLDEHAKLSEDEVREIRRRYREEDVTYKELADEFVVAYQTIGKIIRRETWQHVD